MDVFDWLNGGMFGLVCGTLRVWTSAAYLVVQKFFFKSQRVWAESPSYFLFYMGHRMYTGTNLGPNIVT